MPFPLLTRCVARGAILALALVAGCGPAEGPDDGSPTGPLAAPSDLRLADVLPCDLQPFAEAGQVFGPAGGTLVVGPHRLVIPPGALASEVRISGRAAAERVSAVDFAPEGLHFLVPATLVLDYAHCPVGRLPLPKQVAYTSDQGTILEILGGLDDLGGARISTEVGHFSRYAVAW